MMAIAASNDDSFLRIRKVFRFFWILPLLLVLPAVSMFAAEGTAHLTFQKVVPAHDKRQVYIVKQGDMIARVVRKLGLPGPRPYRMIKQLNPHIPDLNRIYPGQKLFLPHTEQQEGATGEFVEAMNYRAQKGDSITRIMISELHAEPTELTKILRVIKQLNPAVADFDKIYPGQVIKIPRGREAVDGSGKFSPSAPAKSGGDEKPLAIQPSATDKYLPVIRHVVEQLNGTVMTSGSHYIPLPESGQVTIDCSTIPVVELGDGTTILLDHAGRIPAALAAIIQSHWKNYHVVQIARGQGIAAVLQEILRFSPSFQMVKMETPLSFDDTSQVKLFLDWLITRKLPTGSGSSQLGLIFAADTSLLLPSSSIVTYARKKGITVCEILGDKVRTGIPEPDQSLPLPQIKGANHDELLENFLVYLGFEPQPNREVRIFESQKDGFDLAIKAEYLIKMGGKSLLITKNKLPPEFSGRLKQQGMTAFYAAPGATKITLLEGLLAALDIPYQFALFALPPPQEKTRVRVSFPALKIAREKGAAYLIDYDIDREIYELLTGHWKLNIIHY